MLLRNILLIGLLTVSFISTNIGQSNYSWVPKLKWTSAVTGPQVDQVKFDGQSGFDIGIELQGKGSYYFYPGLYYSQFNSEMIVIDESGSQEVNIGTVTNRLLKIPLNIGVYLNDRNKNVAMRYVMGVQPSFRIGEPDYEGAVLEQFNIQYDMTVHGTFGLGFDIGNMTLDIGYEVNFVKMFRRADEASNFLTVGVGYKL